MHNPFDLTNRVVVVTGGTGFLGSHYCRNVAKAGAKIVVSDINEDKCKSLAKEIKTETNSDCEGMAVDLSNEKLVKLK